MPEHTEQMVKGAGGVDIFRQSWLPDGEARADIVLAHGASEHSGRYAWVAEQLNARGYAVHALDHRGHGRSSGSRALIDSMEKTVADLDSLVDDSRGGRPLFLLGHSMGGAIALAYTIRHEDKLDGLVLSGPVAVVEAASPVTRAIGRLLSSVAPKAGVYSIDSSAVSRDPEVVRDYDADPLNYHGKLPARTVIELTDEVGRFPDALSKLTLPILVMHGQEDKLVPPAAAELVNDRAGSDDLTIIRYDGLYHEILNEPERERVVGDIADWLDAHVGAAAPERSAAE